MCHTPLFFVCVTLVLVLACIYATRDPPTPMLLCNATTPHFSICHTRFWPHLSFLCVVSSFILRRIFLYFGGVYDVTPYSHTVDLASPGADAIRTAGHPEGGELTGNGASRAALVRLLEAEGTHVAADTSSRTSLTMAISTFSNSDRRERRSAWTISWRQKKKKEKCRPHGGKTHVYTSSHTSSHIRLQKRSPSFSHFPSLPRCHALPPPVVFPRRDTCRVSLCITPMICFGFFSIRQARSSHRLP